MKNELEIPAIAAVLKDIPDHGIIELRTLWFKDAKARIEPTKVASTGRLLGVAKLSEDDKKQLTFIIEPTTFLYIGNHHQIDLSKFEDRLTWAMMKHNPLIAESFHIGQNTPGAMFYVSNEVEESRKDMETEDLLFTALSYIHNDKNDELIARARLLGVDMAGEPADTAKKYLLKLTRESGGVEKIIGVYSGNKVATTILLYKAIDKGIIKSKNNVFMYGTLPLGADEDVVLQYLQAPNNASLVDQIKQELNPEVFGTTAPKTSTGTRAKQ